MVCKWILSLTILTKMIFKKWSLVFGITLVIVWVGIDGLRHPLAFVHHPIVGVLVLDLENKLY